MSSRNNYFCQRPWENILVLADGGVRFCCHFRGFLGNLEEQDFETIWNGPLAQKVRQEFIDNQLPAECQLCPLINQYSSITVSPANLKLESGPESRV